MGSGGTVGHGEPRVLHLFPAKDRKQPLKAGLHPLNARGGAGRCGGSRAEHQMHVRHWQVWDEARAAWVREGKMESCLLDQAQALPADKQRASGGNAARSRVFNSQLPNWL